jgi:hypothetical protein
MSTEVRPSLAGDLTTFTTRLDGLRANQNPNDLSNALWAAFKQRELYNLYISSLARDTERAKGLLEVFDKVRSAYNVYHLIDRFSASMRGAGPSSHHIRCHNL